MFLLPNVAVGFEKYPICFTLPVMVTTEQNINSRTKKHFTQVVTFKHLTIEGPL